MYHNASWSQPRHRHRPKTAVGPHKPQLEERLEGERARPAATEGQVKGDPWRQRATSIGNWTRPRSGSGTARGTAERLEISERSAVEICSGGQTFFAMGGACFEHGCDIVWNRVSVRMADVTCNNMVQNRIRNGGAH